MFDFNKRDLGDYINWWFSVSQGVTQICRTKLGLKPSIIYDIKSGLFSAYVGNLKDKTKFEIAGNIFGNIIDNTIFKALKISNYIKVFDNGIGAATYELATDYSAANYFEKALPEAVEFYERMLNDREFAKEMFENAKSVLDFDLIKDYYSNVTFDKWFSDVIDLFTPKAYEKKGEPILEAEVKDNNIIVKADNINDGIDFINNYKFNNYDIALSDYNNSVQVEKSNNFITISTDNNSNLSDEDLFDLALFSGANKASINNVKYDIKQLDNDTLKDIIDYIPSKSFVLTNIKILVGEEILLGDNKKYVVKQGDTIIDIAKANKMSVKSLIKLNPNLIEQGRVKFLEDKVLVEANGDLAKIFDYKDFVSNTFGNALKEDFNGDFKNSLYKNKTLNIFYNPTAKVIKYDPLVLDLNNNGRIDTITLNNSKAFFDHNNDNIAYKSSWISKDDGLLVLDKNNNNLIDNGNELFGNFTEISSNSYALNGFEALKLLDSNEDGVIDINDKEFNNLKVWQDLNEDGITQINELKSLKDLNITSINLNYKDTNQKLDNDNTITQTATFIKDGKESLLADINFSVSSIERVFKDKIIYSEEELNLANLKGYGVLRDLRDAACLDEELKALLKDYSLANSKEEQLNKLDSLIYSWANTNKALNKDFNLSKTKEFDSDNPNNTDSIRDLWLTPSQAREYANFTISESLKNEFNELKQKISIINSFLGVNNQDFYVASLNEFNELRNSFNNTYDSLRTYVYKGLLFQTRLKEYYNEINITSYENNGSYELKLDFSKSIEKFKAINETNPKKAFVDLAEFITSFKDINSLNDCVILLGSFIKTMDSNTLSDYLKLLDEDTINALSTQTGTNANDTLVGTNLLNGKDVLYGLDGDDTLIGGIGDDTLVGGNGNDTYVFDKDFGHDTIINYKSNLNDIDCIQFNDASINADNLKYVRNYNDLMLIKDDSNSIRVKDFFAYEDLRNTIDEIKFANNTSINKDEIINRVYTPTNGDDNFTMFFTNKDYVITMLDGNDTIITHNGDDIIDGGDGDDIIRSGAGNDIINGGNGNDDIYAGDGDDIIIGGAGDDILQGGMGNDKYIYKGVWGHDRIINLRNDNAYDEIILDVSSSFVKITRDNDDLIINKLKSAGWFRKVVDDSSSIKVVDFFKKDYDISALVMQDKTLSADELRQMVLTPTWGNDTLIGSEYSDKIYGLFGNDTLIGGKGDDYLDGGAGNDTYIFNRGDGNDYIKDALGYDTIKFNDISFSEVVLKKDVDNLIIKYNNNKDSVTILGNFGIGFNKIEKFVFSDKTLCYDDFINTAKKELPSYEDLVDKVTKPDLSSYLENSEKLIQDTNAYAPNSSGFILYTDDKNNTIQVYL
ncbi:RTX toxin-related calcium-binding protein (peptidase M10 serralysin domains) [Campylobacter sp. RM5004]|uniref:calcium-binding protein n=1 Tax=Campylobacter sp. RM5004 TaxID=1660078 RepID=UPI001EFB529A|nr:calcium-binding protein [Campylobacter sp. RM5004]ULO01546.1 RTX toxin-related calcium-binding protein (peptidase M10 serralysin domains) [Campylobacter sp. RM5004]